GELAIRRDRGNSVAGCKCAELPAAAEEECISADHQRLAWQLNRVCKGRVELGLAAGVWDMKLETKPARGNLCLSRVGFGPCGAGRVDEQCDGGRVGRQFVQELQLLWQHLHVQ